MNRNRFTIILFLILLLVGAVIYFWPNPPSSLVSTTTTAQASPSALPGKKGGTSSQNQTLPAPVASKPTQSNKPVKNEPDYNAIKIFGLAFMKPFSFWGKVLDEKGNPVSGANVLWEASNNPNPNGSGSEGKTMSDANGIFVIKNHGIGLFVKVAKDGYYEMPTEANNRGSYGGFSNTPKLGASDSPMGTEQEPAIFILKRKGLPIGLIKVEHTIDFSTKGAPVGINLKNGNPTAPGQGDIQVECWAHVEGIDISIYNRYDWRCRVSVPGGGLVERTNSLEFTAPISDYQALDQIEMPSRDEKWDSQAVKEYFCKLANGCYARFELRIVTGAHKFLKIESYMNPQPGSRNLEYDPAKKINP